MRTVLILTVSAGVACCGPLGIGVKGGVPATGLVMSSYHDSGSFPSTGSRYVAGPTVELRLPFGLGIEADALYRHVINPSGNAWEVPLLAKVRLPARGSAVPYAVGGGVFKRNEILRAFQVGPPETTSGFVIGGGLELRLGPVRLGPELRYTRWTGDFSFRGYNLINRNQVEFLFGITL